MILIITATFTSVAILAVILHLQYLREVVLDRRALREEMTAGRLVDPRGSYAKIATQRVNVEGTRLVINLIVAMVGIGSLAGFHPVGWLLIFIPVVSATASWLDLRGRH